MAATTNTRHVTKHAGGTTLLGRKVPDSVILRSMDAVPPSPPEFPAPPEAEEEGARAKVAEKAGWWELTGRRTVKVAPFPNSLSTDMDPPMSSTSWRETE